MKVLFHSLVDYEDLPEYGHRLDYLADSVFHGFRDLLGEDAVDYPKMEHMYKENFSLVKTSARALVCTIDWMIYQLIEKTLSKR